MKRNKCFVLIPCLFPEYTDEVLDIPWIVLHFARVVPFDRKGDSKANFIEADFLIVVKDIFVEHLADGRVVTIKELDHLDGGVDESDDHDEESNDAAYHGVDGRHALQIERR